MTKSAYQRTLEKQAKEAKKEAEAATRREIAKSIIDGQPIKNDMRIMDVRAEQLLRIILDIYDGGETNRVWLGIENVPESFQRSLNLEVEKLRMYGVISDFMPLFKGCEVYLSPEGKTYFSNKENAENHKQGQRKSISIQKTYDVFLSHADKDKLDYVDSLYITLKKLGIEIFYDREELAWGDDWKQTILDGVEKSEFAIVVISNKFFGREWTERELKELLQRQNENGQKIILPLLFDVSFEDLKTHYPELEYIQSMESSKKTPDEIAVLLAKELIKRYR